MSWTHQRAHIFCFGLVIFAFRVHFICGFSNPYIGCTTVTPRSGRPSMPFSAMFGAAKPSPVCLCPLWPNFCLLLYCRWVHIHTHFPHIFLMVRFCIWGNAHRRFQFFWNFLVDAHAGKVIFIFHHFAPPPVAHMLL